MTNKKQELSWVDKKLQDPKFRKGFDDEYAKLSIGEQLLQLRQEAHLTQAQLASRVGTTGSAISRYENASYNRYELQTLRKIVEACGGHMRIIFEAADAPKHAR